MQAAAPNRHAKNILLLVVNALKPIIKQLVCWTLSLLLAMPAFAVQAAEPAPGTLDVSGVHIDDVVNQISQNHLTKSDIVQLLKSIQPMAVTPSVYNHVYVTGVSITPTSATIPVGGTQSFTKTISPANATNQDVNWTSSDPSVAKVVYNTGVATGIGAGTAAITATTADGGYTASAVISVLPVTVPVTGISIAPAVSTIPLGGSQMLTKTVTPANASNPNATWTSSNPSVAAVVYDTGAVKGVGIGTATITATTLDGLHSESALVIVVPVPITGITVTPAKATITWGDTAVFTSSAVPAGAVNPAVTWTSSNPSVAAVVYNTGVVTGVSPGTAIITATTLNGTFSAWAGITVLPVSVSGISVSPASATIIRGQTQTLTKTVTPMNASNPGVIWTTSDPSVAIVDPKGNVTGVGVGTATIAATTIDGGYHAGAVIAVTQIQGNAGVTIVSPSLRNTAKPTVFSGTVYDPDGNEYVGFVKVRIKNQNGQYLKSDGTFATDSTVYDFHAPVSGSTWSLTLTNPDFAEDTGSGNYYYVEAYANDGFDGPVSSQMFSYTTGPMTISPGYDVQLYYYMGNVVFALGVTNYGRIHYVYQPVSIAAAPTVQQVAEGKTGDDAPAPEAGFFDTIGINTNLLAPYPTGLETGVEYKVYYVLEDLNHQFSPVLVTGTSVMIPYPVLM